MLRTALCILVAVALCAATPAADDDMMGSQPSMGSQGGDMGQEMIRTDPAAPDLSAPTDRERRQDERRKIRQQRRISAEVPAEVREFTPNAPAAGETAPDVHLLDGGSEPVRISDFRGRVLVIEFMSTSSEIAMAKVGAMNALRRKYADSDKVAFLSIVGTEQADQAGRYARVDRRQFLQDVDVSAHVAAAGQLAARTEHGTVATDGPRMSARLEYGSQVNGAYIIDESGKVFRRWAWLDPGALEATLAEMVGNPTGRRDVAFAGQIRPKAASSGGPGGRRGGNATARRNGAQQRGAAQPFARELVSLGAEGFMAKHDTNKDQSLSRTELKGLPEEAFTRMDRDENKVISLEELVLTKDFTERRMQQEGARP